MIKNLLTLLGVVSVLTCGLSSGIGPKRAMAAPDTATPAALPRVLLIGDSITWGYAPNVQKDLAGIAEVHLIPVNGQETGFGLQHLDEWLGNTKWDVIHFNWGLWDICYRNPEAQTQGQRDKVHGTITTTPEQYRTNLAALVKRLKATGAHLVWASITPVPENEIGRKPGDAAIYNAIAAKLMHANGIAVDDLYACALPHLRELQLKGGNVHYTEAGYQTLSKQVEAAIKAALR